MRTGPAREALVALVLWVWLAAVRAGTTGSPTATNRHEMPAELAPVTVAMLSGCAILAVLACAALLVNSGGRLAVIIGVISAQMLMLVGVCSWLVTYLQTRDVIHERTEQLLVGAADRGEAHIESQFLSGINVVRLFQEAISAGQYGMGASYPAAHFYMAWMMHNLKTDFIELVYYGRTAGTAVGTAPLVVGAGRSSAPGTDVYLILGVFSRSKSPPYVLCPAVDRENVNASSCAEYTCGADEATDFACQATCHAQNPSKFPGVSSEYCAMMDTEPTARLTLFDAKYNPSESSLLAPPAGSDVDPVAWVQFDARQRPWWTVSRTPHFTKPYVFATSIFGIGITLAAGCYDASGRYLGTVAVDFTLSSLHQVLKDLRPTKHSEMFFVDIDGALVGTTMTAEAIAADTGAALNEVVSVHDIPRGKSSVIARTINVLTAEYDGTLSTVCAYSTTIHVDDHVYMARPVDATYQHYLLILTLPYSDVMGSADNATVVALLITIAVSLAVGGLLFVFVTILLRPLKQLEARMISAASMEVDFPAAMPSRVAEVSRMQHAFGTMVGCLASYKDFLPQSVLQPEGSMLPPGGVSSPSGSDMSDASSVAAHEGRRSRGSTCSGDAAHQPSLILFSLSVSRKRITHMSVAFRDLGSVLTVKSHAHMHSDCVSHVLECAKMHRGVVDALQGDIVTVLFNAHMTVAGQHRIHALCCALDVTHHAPHHDILPLSAGLASDPALVGNVGCQGLKKFTVLGPMPQCTAWFAKLAALWRLNVLATAQYLSEEMVSRALYAVEFPPEILERSKHRCTMLHEIFGVTSTCGEEWMYQLESASRSPYGLMLGALEHVFDGKHACARSKLEAIDVSAINDATAAHICALSDMIETGHTPCPLQLGVVLPPDACRSWLTVHANPVTTKMSKSATRSMRQKLCLTNPLVGKGARAGNSSLQSSVVGLDVTDVISQEASVGVPDAGSSTPAASVDEPAMEVAAE